MSPSASPYLRMATEARSADPASVPSVAVATDRDVVAKGGPDSSSTAVARRRGATYSFSAGTGASGDAPAAGALSTNSGRFMAIREYSCSDARITAERPAFFT